MQDFLQAAAALVAGNERVVAHPLKDLERGPAVVTPVLVDGHAGISLRGREKTSVAQGPRAPRSGSEGRQVTRDDAHRPPRAEEPPGVEQICGAGSVARPH